MLFNSYTFLLGFLPVVLVMYFILGRRSYEAAIAWLAASSLFFYGWWNPHYLVLILGSIGVPDDVIVADFELSNDGLARLRKWAESHDSNLKDRLGNAPAAFLDADGRALGDLMTKWSAEHGSIRNFARHLGVSDEALERLDARLVTTR